MRYALVLALASCGRFGFSSDPMIVGDNDAAALSDMIQLIVTTDRSGALAAGVPVSGATVLVDRGTATLERLTTDGRGMAALKPGGIVAYHVLYGSANAWRLYTVATGATGSITLGGNTQALAHKTSIVLPTAPGSDYTATFPERCGSSPSSTSSTTVSYQYVAECEGQTVRAIAFNANTFSNPRYLDLGMVKLADGAKVTATGSFAPAVTHKITLTNLPPQAASVSTRILARTPTDLTRMDFEGAGLQTAITGATMTVTSPAAPGGNTLLIRTSPSGKAGVAYPTSAQIVPISFSGAPASASFDASTMLPMFSAVDFGTTAAVTWTGGTGATIMVVHVQTDQYEWNAYLPPTATSLPFPVIPVDIGFPSGARPSFMDLMALDVPGTTAASLTPTIDQTWRHWLQDTAPVPDTGVRVATARYIMGL